MQGESSFYQSPEYKALIALAYSAESGQLDELECPVCHGKSVSVWFKGWERTLFKCDKCDFDSLAVNALKPDFYSKERDLNAKKELTATKA